MNVKVRGTFGCSDHGIQDLKSRDQGKKQDNNAGLQEIRL